MFLDEKLLKVVFCGSYQCNLNLLYVLRTICMMAG